MVSSNQRTILGQHGEDWITDTQAHTPPTGQRWIALDLLEECVFAELAGDGMTLNGEAITGLTNLTLPAGTLYGRYTGIELTSGRVKAYRDAPSDGGGLKDYPG